MVKPYDGWLDQASGIESFVKITLCESMKKFTVDSFCDVIVLQCTNVCSIVHYLRLLMLQMHANCHNAQIFLYCKF